MTFFTLTETQYFESAFFSEPSRHFFHLGGNKGHRKDFTLLTNITDLGTVVLGLAVSEWGGLWLG